MSDKFLGGGGSFSTTLTNGTVAFYGASLGAQSLEPSQPIKTNSLRQLVSSKLNISDIINLQSTLDNVLTNPFNGTLQATDFETQNFFSVDDELKKIENVVSATQSPDITNISGLVNVDEIAVDRVYNASKSIWIDMTSTDVDVSASYLKLNGNDVLTTPYIGQIEATSFKKTGATNSQYLMGDGSILEQSAVSGNSNFYLYNNNNGITTPPPSSGFIGYNDANQSLATIVYISHITSDNIDIEVYYSQLSILNDLYIQDKNNSLNFIKYNITGLNIVNNSYIAINVSVISSGGNGSTSFGSGHNVLVSFFSNNLEIDTRLSNLENNKLDKGGGMMSGMLDMDNNAIENVNKITMTGSIEVGFNNVNGYNIFSSLLIGSGNQTTDADQILVGVSNTSASGSNITLAVGRQNVCDSPYGVCLGTQNITDNQNNQINIGFNNSTSGEGSMAFGSNIVNPHKNSLCIGTSNMEYIYPNSAVCYLGRPDAPFFRINIANGIVRSFAPSPLELWATDGSVNSTVVTNANNALSVANSAYSLANTANNTANTASTNATTALGRTIGQSYIASPTTKTVFSQMIDVGANRISSSFVPLVNTDLCNKLYADTNFATYTVLGNYLLKSGGVMSGNLNMNNNKILNASELGTSNGTILVGYGNTSSYSSTSDNIAVGTFNTISDNQQIFFGVGNQSLTSSNIVLGVGVNNQVNSFYSSVIGNSNVVSGQQNFVFGNDNTTTANNAHCFGNSITNNISNSFCFGDPAITQIYPNSLVCDLGNTTKPFKDLYIGGHIKQSAYSFLDFENYGTNYVGILFNQGTSTIATRSTSNWTALGSTTSNAPTYNLTNVFTRQPCCALFTTVALADGAPCGFVSTATTGVAVNTGFSWGLQAFLGIADSAYNANNCQNFYGLWNTNTGVGLTQALQLSTRTNFIAFGSNTTDSNICIYTGGASSTVKQVDLGSAFPANRPSGSVSTDFFRLSMYYNQPTNTVYYKAINITQNVTVMSSFTPTVASMPLSSVALYPQVNRTMGTPQTNGQARLQVQRFGVLVF